MTQYKTVPMPRSILTGIKSKDLDTIETAQKALAPYGQVVQHEAKGGWALHSMVTAPATIKRKKGIMEKLFGWIPVIGFLFMPKNSDIYYYPKYIMLIFKKED